jgi:hypothetical protein
MLRWQVGAVARGIRLWAGYSKAGSIGLRVSLRLPAKYDLNHLRKSRQIPLSTVWKKIATISPETSLILSPLVRVLTYKQYLKDSVGVETYQGFKVS